MAQTVEETTQDELKRRHSAAARAVLAMLLFTALLMGLALAGVFAGALRFDAMTTIMLRLIIVFLGIGAIVYRRTMFLAMRLQDIGAVRAPSALLRTLESTTVTVALIGGLIAILGFVISMMTGFGRDMLYLGVIAVAVLLYCYPRRAGWSKVVAAAERGEGDPVRAAKGTTV